MAKFEGIVGVNMQSKFDSTQRRVKFEDQDFWYGADASLADQLERGSKVLVMTEGSGKNAMIRKVKVLEASAGGGYRKNTGKPYGKAQGGTGTSAGLSKEEWAEKDLAIRYQHSQKVGASLLETALAQGVITIPKKNAEDVFIGYFDRFTAAVFNDIAGRDAVTRVGGDENESDDIDDIETEAGTDDSFEDDLNDDIDW